MKPRGVAPSNHFPSTWFWPLLFLIVTLLYLETLNPSLFRNDSPETITACFTLGVSHPPGYPLHSLLGRLFSLLQIGNPAMTLNFFAAVLSALGVCLFAWNAFLLTDFFLAPRVDSQDRPSATFSVLVGSLCFALSKSYWSASLAAKGGIYILQVLIELGFLVALQLWLKPYSQEKSKPTLYFLIFLFALGLINHWPTQALLIPALLVGYSAYSSSDDKKKLSLTNSSGILICLLIGLIVLSLYLYLPLRAHLGPSLNFGDPDSFHRFFRSVLRIFYFKRETLASFLPTARSTMLDKGLYISNHLTGDFNLLFDLFALWGLWALLRRGLKTQLVFLLFGLLSTLAANWVYLQVTPIDYWHMDDHLLTLNWIFGFLGTVGICRIQAQIDQKKPLKIFGVFFFSILPFLTLLTHFPWNDQKNEFLFRDYGINALKSMKRGAYCIAESDYDYFSILYLKELERKRPDVRVKLVTFLTPADWQKLNLGLAPTDLSGNQPIYCAFPNGEFINAYIQQLSRVSLRPSGILIEVNPPRDRKFQNLLTQPLDDLWEKSLIPGHRSFNPINSLLESLCAHPYINMANYQGSRGQWEHWDTYYERALGLIRDPRWRAETWANKADGDLKLGKTDLASQGFLGAYSDYQLAGLPKEAQKMLDKNFEIEPRLAHPAPSSSQGRH